MIKPKEISEERYGKLYRKYMLLAIALRRASGLCIGPAGWFSTLFSPCSGIKIWGDYKVPNSSIWHFSKQPCNNFCADKLPIVSCLAKVNDKYYYCRHKVGNCPWKTERRRKQYEHPHTS